MAKPKDSIKQIGYYAAALKAPPIRDSAARLAAQARDAGWTHEEYLAAMLSREVSSRESSGAELWIRAAGFPRAQGLEEFNFDHQPALKRDVIAHLATGAFIDTAQNVVLLWPPGTGKTHPVDRAGDRRTPPRPSGPASPVLTSNLPFSRWGDVFSDHVVAAAMIDRIVHHADVLTLKGSTAHFSADLPPSSTELCSRADGPTDGQRPVSKRRHC